MAQSYLGEIKNKPICSYGVQVSVQGVENITKGMLVYIGKVNGVSVAPDTGNIEASRIGMVEIDSDNSQGSLGDKSLEVYKAHCIGVIKLDGTIKVGEIGRASTNIAGHGQELLLPTDLPEQLEYTKHALFRYLAHPDEYINAKKQPTDGGNNDEIVVEFL